MKITHSCDAGSGGSMAAVRADHSADVDHASAVLAAIARAKAAVRKQPGGRGR
jgi:hypothetical protein